MVDCRIMAKPDWLSIEEITRLWGEETGLDAAAFREDLEAWFAEFVKQPPASQPLIRGGTADSTNRLMGLLGARYLERSIFQAYCEERGHPKPRFWFGDRVDESWRDKRRPSEPAPSSPEAAPSRPGEQPSEEGEDSDPELVAFQTQIAGLSERLETNKTDISGFSKPAAAARRGVESERGPTRPAAEPSQQQPIEQAASATAEVRELKAQLETAERRIADLSAQSDEDLGASPARSSAPTSPPPERRGHDPATRGGRDLPSYRDPGASSQLLRRAAARRRTGIKVAATLGLAVLVVATLLWGVKTAIQLAGDAASSPPGETADATGGRGAADGGAPPPQSTLMTSAGEGQAGTDTPSAAPTAGTLGTGGHDLAPVTTPAASGSTDTPAVGMGLAAAQQQIAHLGAAVEASDAMVARLQDELAIARRTAEAALQSSPEKSADHMREQRLAAQALSAEVAIARRQLKDVRRQAEGNADAQSQRRELMSSVTALSARVDALKRSLETNRQQTAEMTSDLETAKAEVTRLRVALKRTEEQAAEADSARHAAAAEAAQVRTTLGRTKNELQSLGKQLEAARGSVAEANESAAEARAETTRLRQESARVTDEVAKVNADASNLRDALERSESGRQELILAATAASARVAALQRELKAAYLQVDMLDKAKKSTEGEALRLREMLADRQPETSSALPVSAGPVEPADPDAAEGDTAKPDIGESLAAAESSPEPATISVIGPSAASDGDMAGDFEPVPETDAGGASDPLASTDPQAESTPSLDPAKDDLEQVAALGSTQAALQSDAGPDTVAADDLLLEPGNHVGREVVVTGSVVWLLWRYRLQSKTGKSSMVIDLKGLRPDERTELGKAINEAGVMGEVRARIRGTVERQGPESYRLGASELVVIQ
jgi:hypothetical protein